MPRSDEMYQPQFEAMERQVLEPLQVELLRNTIAHIAIQNPAYHAKLGSPLAIDMRTLAHLRQLPLQNKNDLRDAYPLAYLCCQPRDVLRVHMSSGTSGQPVVCPYTQRDLKGWKEIMGRCLYLAGLRRGDPFQVSAPFGLMNGGFGCHFGAEELGALLLPIGGGRSLMQLRMLRDFGTRVIVGIASYFARLIELADEEGFDFRSEAKLKSVVAGSEMWSDNLRRKIEARMGVKSYDVIGMTETGGVGMGIDCDEQAGVHVWEDHYIAEVIDPATGEAAPDGEPGELVITTLKREALPVVRYRTGDITAVVSREPCACGRTSLRIARFTGRSDDMITLKGTKFYPQQVENIIMAHPEVAQDYVITLSTDEHELDQARLTIETDGAVGESLRAHLARELHDYLGFTIEVRLVPVGELPRPQGKAVRVVDERRAR